MRPTYMRRWDDYHAKIGRGEKADPPKRDLQLDTLSGVLRGEIRVQNHCYRADEMATMIDISHEFGFHIAAFHHASEAYKIAPLLKKEGICILTWADWANFKMESLDGIEANAALAHRGGVCVVIHSDDPIITQHLNQEAGIAMGAGNRMGLNITRAEAIAWITANPAKAIGVLDKTGTLETGKMADVVLWSADPFSIYAKADKGVHRRGAGVRPLQSALSAQIRLRAWPTRRRSLPMSRAFALALLGATLLAAPALAETVAITNAKIETVGAAGEIANGTVIIKDGKIAPSARA